MPACTGAKREKCRNGARAAGNGSFAFSQRGPFVYTPPGAGLCRSPAASSRRMYGADTCPPAQEQSGRSDETGDDGGESLLRVFSKGPVCPQRRLMRSCAAASQRLRGGCTAQVHARLHGVEEGEASKRGDGGGKRLLRIFSKGPVCPHAAGRRTACGP